MIQLKFEAKGFRDTQGRMAKRSDQLADGRRELVRTEGRQMVAALRREAPKKTGAFAKGIRYLTRDQGYIASLTIYSSGEHAFLLPLIVGGTRAHEIPTGGAAAQQAKGYPLSFWWAKGPRGPGMYHFWSVMHPGTAENPFIDRAMQERYPVMKSNLQKMVAAVATMEQYTP